MLRGLYSVSTVLEQNTQAINVSANNLANANATAYKRDIAVSEEFHAKLLSKVGGSPLQIKTQEATVAVKENAETTRLEVVNGYFRVDAPGGVSHNTGLEFRVGDDGFLRTVYRNGYHNIIEDAGYLVLGENGPIQVGDQNFEVNEQGQITIDGQTPINLVYKPGKNIIGTLSGGIKYNRVVTDFEQSDLIRTENNLDFALTEPGFFTVQTPSGEMYTRNGQFKLNENLEMVTGEGFNVMGINGPIQLTQREFAINKFGEISIDGLVVDKFVMVNPQNVERMKKIGVSLFRFDGDMEEVDYQGEIVQGFLEGSNVNSLKEMIQIMETYRAYESAQRVVRSYDDTLAKAVADVARV